MRKLTTLVLTGGLAAALIAGKSWAGGRVVISAPQAPDANFSGTDKAPAGVPITVNLNDNPCATSGYCPSNVEEVNAGVSYTLHWGTVDGNGNWITSNDAPMTGSNNGVPTCGSFGVFWTAQIPAQPAGTKIEFVIHHVSTSRGVDEWLKDAGKEGGPAPCPSSANPANKGWARVVTNSGSSNFYYTAIETPYVTLDFPQENEIIRSTAYTIRIGANGSTNNVRVKIDTGDWSQARFASGYWWFDWANYPVGAHTIIAEGWNELGQRSETSPRHCTYQP